eukprot:CAMPEP_0117502238 /NCGR_PEP_ID=MMETSP0784-20121206/23710_1 /TAXON_ID=39447 /ORGANISM="" /LENGTH=512 /DNA_ID=CAMNT_0005297515 /DNA_START=161 /DNA_END=1699 /DNA_ORIENTATION=-
MKPTNTGLAGAVKLVVRTFLEQKHYRQLHRVLAEEWSSCHSLTAAVRLMEAHGVRVTPEEEQRFATMPEDRMIDALVTRMPSQTREQFEHFFLQLSLIASTTTRLRNALEKGDAGQIDEVMESAENVGILQFILKMAVAQAGNEVKMKEQAHDDWLADTDSRMAPLLKSAAQAMVSNIALAQAKAQLGAYRSESNSKSKKVLLGMVAGNERTLLSTTTLAWFDYVRRLKRENVIRKDYEEEINKANKNLTDYKAKALKSIRTVLMRNAAGSKHALMVQCYKALKEEAIEVKDFQATHQDAKELEEKLKGFADGARTNAKNVLARMNAGNEESLKSMIWSAWLQFIVEYRKNKEMEDAVKAAEHKLAAFRAKQNAGTQSILAKMQSATATNLLKSSFLEWKDVYEDEKRMNDTANIMGTHVTKFGNFAARSKGTALHEMNRMQQVNEQTLLFISWTAWKRETKVERVRRYGKERNQRKKAQLQGVKGLFKNFATELETDLNEGTPRVELKPKA